MNEKEVNEFADFCNVIMRAWLRYKGKHEFHVLSQSENESDNKSSQSNSKSDKPLSRDDPEMDDLMS